MTFAELQLLPAIQKALSEEQYLEPTPVQAVAIPHLLAGADLFGCAQTGTGKTAAFALPILDALGRDTRKAVPKAPRVLVMSPTRELAAQIDASFQTYGRHLRVHHAVIFGGVGQFQQVRALQRGVHVLVATPGRLLDLMNQGHVRLDELEVFVLDEADRMLDMGFLPDLKRIIRKLPEKRQSIFFSATLPERVAELAEELLRDPVRVEITPQATTVELIEQRVLHVEPNNKRALLDEILQSSGLGQVLVFSRTKHQADRIARDISKNGVQAKSIHGDKSQNDRKRILEGFRDGRFQVLVATDLAARGLDVDGITHVINYDLPVEPENYVHRIGRTGRAGATGIALTFCGATERRQLKLIEKMIRTTIPVDANHAFHAPPPPTRSEPPRKPAGPKHRGKFRPGSRGKSRRPVAARSTQG